MITLKFAVRNLKIFFRDRAAVFFSLLSALIIIGLYVLFLGDMLTSGMKAIPGSRFLVDSWIMAGLLSVTSITTTMGAFGIMVEDKHKKTVKDFTASPVRRSTLAGGYVLSSFVIGVIMTVITFVLAEGYIVIYGGRILDGARLVKLLGVMLLSVIASTAFVFFLVTFFKSNNAFATASMLLGTLIGFLTGVYIPVGELPEAVQYVIKFFPVSHASLLFRQVMMEVPLQTAFAGAPVQVAKDFRESMGVSYSFGGVEASMAVSLWVLAGTAVIFFLLATWNLSRKSK
jgi:multidrug/hemolysin transport system permease protein